MVFNFNLEHLMRIVEMFHCIDGSASDAKLVLTTINEAVNATNEALNVYDKLIENVIPWDRFKVNLDEMEKLSDDVSTETGLFFGQIKTDMLDGFDGYFHASSKIYEWVSLVESHMKLYVKLFDNHDAQRAETQKVFLIKMLENGIAQLTEAVAELGKSSQDFKSVRDKLLALRRKFGPKFDGKFAESLISEKDLTVNPDDLWRMVNEILKFYGSLKKNANQTKQNIVHAKRILRADIRLISELKTQVQQKVRFVHADESSDLRAMVIHSAERLIGTCAEYRKRHNNKTHSF